MDSVLVPLSGPSRGALERIKASGFADDDVAAVRVAIADMASRLGPPPGSAAVPAPVPTPPAPMPTDPRASRAGAKAALKIAEREECTCRVATGRHHLLLALLGALASEGQANWLAVLARARESAERYNRENKLPLSQPPAAVAFNPAAMSQNWMRAYINGGAGKFGEQYSRQGPHVMTRAVPTGKGVRIELV